MRMSGPVMRGIQRTGPSSTTWPHPAQMPGPRDGVSSHIGLTGIGGQAQGGKACVFSGTSAGVVSYCLTGMRSPVLVSTR